MLKPSGGGSAKKATQTATAGRPGQETPPSGVMKGNKLNRFLWALKGGVIRGNGGSGTGRCGTQVL